MRSVMKKKRWVRFVIGGVLITCVSGGARAEITEKDILVVGRLAGMLEGVKDAAAVQVAVVSDDAASRADATYVLELVGASRKIGNITLKAEQVLPDAIANTTAQVILLPESLDDGNISKIHEVAVKRQLAVVSMSETCLEKKYCAIAIKTQPAVDIKMSSSVAAETGVKFGSAVRMLIKEVP